jgi:hypothetical protein
MVSRQVLDVMTSQSQNGGWLPLMVYAMRRGVSLSTLRRHIKSNKIQYRVENGRYLLFDDSASEDTLTMFAPQAAPEPEPSPVAPDRLHKLEHDLRKAQEEIAELKMLVAIYEEQITTG